MNQIKVAIIEDEENATEDLKNALDRFSKDNDIHFLVETFKEGLTFLDDTKAYDLIFMDIEMPHMNGIDVAKKLRQKDDKVALIFVTNMVQYAIKGYEVDAIDYVLKPLKYARFQALMKKTLRIIDKTNEAQLVLKTTGGMRKLYYSSIVYIEIRDHLLIYHTDQGDIETWGTISGAEENLPKEEFCRCSHSMIVNFRYIQEIEKDSIILKGIETPISISHSKKKDFLIRFNKYLGIK